jgi:hypothetical protein
MSLPPNIQIALDTTLENIRAEREYQLTKWAPAFDDRNTGNDWISYITQYLGKASKADNTDDFDTAMVKVATLACAAVEASRRNNGLPPRHYD